MTQYKQLFRSSVLACVTVVAFVTVVSTVRGVGGDFLGGGFLGGVAWADETAPVPPTPTVSAAPTADANAKQTKTEVLVSATRTEHEVFDVAASAAVVTAKQMERSPHSTIAEHLQDIPGVQVTDGGMGGGAKRVTIRGENGARVLILIDGMKISEQKSMDGSMILIAPSNIERIEVIKGPASVLYGSEAIGGVINIITKKGGTKPMQGRISTTYDGSNKSLTPTASLYGSYEGFSYRLSGDLTNAADKEGGSGVIKNSSYAQNNYSAYLDYGWGTGKVGIGYDAFHADINVPGAVSDGADVQIDLPLWSRERLYAFAEVEQLSEYLQKVKLTAFTQETRKEMTNKIDVHQVLGSMRGKNMTLDVNSRIATENTQRSYGVSLQTDWTFGDSHYVVAGLEFLRDNLESTDLRNGSITTVMPPFFLPSTKPSSDNGTFNNTAYQQTWAIYAQDEWSFADDWTATLGLRHSWVQSSLEKTNDSKLKEGTDTGSKLTASAGLVYSGIENWRFRGQYAQGYRYPVLQQMYMGTVHGSADITYPNPNLKPETSHSFELGSRYAAHGIAADLAVYYTSAQDYIYRAVQDKVYFYDNSNTANTYGSELTLSYTYEPWHLTPYVSGNYMYREIDRGTANGGKTNRTGDPRLSGRVGLRYDHDLRPDVNLHVDAFARMAGSAEEQETDGTILKYKGWTTANLAMGVRFGTDLQYFVDLNLNNITNTAYIPAAASLEDPGFNAVITVGLEF